MSRPVDPAAESFMEGSDHGNAERFVRRHSFTIAGNPPPQGVTAAMFQRIPVEGAGRNGGGDGRRYLPIDWDQVAWRDLTTPRHLQITADGTVIERPAPCRADALCRCRTCKPPLSEVRALRRLRIGLIIAALVVAMLIELGIGRVR